MGGKARHHSTLVQQDRNRLFTLTTNSTIYFTQHYTHTEKISFDNKEDLKQKEITRNSSPISLLNLFQMGRTFFIGTKHS